MRRYSLKLPSTPQHCQFISQRSRRAVWAGGNAWLNGYDKFLTVNLMGGTHLSYGIGKRFRAPATQSNDQWPT
jgi:hypothetical protein